MEKEKEISDLIKEQLVLQKENLEKQILSTDKKNDEKIADLNSKLSSIEKAIVDQGTFIQAMSEVSNERKSIDLTKCVKNAVEKLKQNPNSMVEVFKSAPNTILELTHITGDIPQAQREPGFNNIPQQRFVIRSLSNVFSASSNSVDWIEQVATTGSAGMQIEGQVKSLMDTEYKTNSTNVQTIACYIKISKQMLNDIPLIENEIRNNLLYKILLLEETQLLSGNGTSPNLNGILKYAQTVDNPNLESTIPLANELDAISAAISQIRSNSLEQFMPTVVLVNSIDLFRIKHGLKETEGMYLLPNMFMPNGEQIEGVRIITSPSIAAGHFLVADMKMFNIRPYENLNIELGNVNDDFIRNLVTIRAEERLATYVKANDIEAFVYDDFDTVISFINKRS